MKSSPTGWRFSKNWSIGVLAALTGRPEMELESLLKYLTAVFKQNAIKLVLRSLHGDVLLLEVYFCLRKKVQDVRR